MYNNLIFNMDDEQIQSYVGGFEDICMKLWYMEQYDAKGEDRFVKLLTKAEYPEPVIEEVLDFVTNHRPNDCTGIVVQK